MLTVRNVLDSKHKDLWTVGPETTVYEALEQMAEKDIGALLVVEGERLVGVFSERDYARKVILRGRASRTTAVRELMRTRVLCVGPDRTIEDCMALMTVRRVRRLPVLEDGERLAGIVTIGDVVKALISEKEFLIEELERYITSEGY